MPFTSWTPRPPSDALKQRIFSGRSHPPARAIAEDRGWLHLPWLAPTGGLAALLFCFGVHPIAHHQLSVFPEIPLSHASILAANTVDAPASAILHTAPVHSAANCLVAANFTWTNAALPSSTNRSFSGELAPN